MSVYFFWVKIFVLFFGFGVVSGIIMSFQFGINWLGFMEMVGNVVGLFLVYEVLMVFFFEVVFFGIMLFGVLCVLNWLYMLVMFLVVFGMMMSVFWIFVLNLWMYIFVGFELWDGVVYVIDWWVVVFNLLMFYWLVYMLFVSGLIVVFLIVGVFVYWWLIGDCFKGVWLMLKIGVWMVVILILVQIYVGDMYGFNILEYQLQKVVVMEGNWDIFFYVFLLLFVIFDEEK